MRRREFQRQLRAAGVDGAVFFNGDPQIRYFSGAPVENGCLAVPAKGKPVLFVPGFEAERIRRLTDMRVERAKRMVDDAFSHLGGKVVGIVPSQVTVEQVSRLQKRWKKVVSVEGACTALRAVKTGEEVRRLTKACALTDVLFEELRARLPYCRSERDAAGFLRMAMAQWGVEPSFAPIIASGKNAAVPHHVPSAAKLSGFTVIDFGIVYKNYCSDMTRTVFVGKPSRKERDVYSELLSVQKACIGRVRSDVEFTEVDAFARERVGPSMIHRVGHSLGVEVHDAHPRPWMLQPGSVVTVEPGTYPGPFGIRIEDDVLVTRQGPVVLSQSPKSLVTASRKI